MKILILSYNNPFFNPSVVLKYPDTIEMDELEQVPFLMQQYEKGFFIHNIGKLTTANLLFTIPSKYGRDRSENLMISLVVEDPVKLNSSLANRILKGFVDKLKEIKNVYKAFYVDSKTYSGDKSKLIDIRALMSKTERIIPESEIVFERKDAKILIFGLSLAGKTTIIRCRRKTISKNTLPTISVDISRIIVNNLSILTYDTPGLGKFVDLWKPYLNEQDGLIFVVDVTDRLKFPDAKALLHKITSKPRLENIPLLLLFNKIDLAEVDAEELARELELDSLKTNQYKYYLTSAIKNVNIDDGFNWLAQKLSERALPPPKSDLGIIFSKWDENIGIKIISCYPKDVFDDPELFTIRCFSLSQFIFGGEEFKKVSVILPLPHLKAKTAVFFDYVKDKTIRGGALPLSLILYYNEDVPRTIIDKFTNYVFEKFDKIKENYTDEKFISSQLDDIHATILNNLNSLKPTVEALRIAELRYEALFKAARDAIFIIDKTSGIIVDANTQAENLMKLPSEEVIGMHAQQFEIVNEEKGLNDRILHQLEESPSYPMELVINDAHGYEIPIEINASEIEIGGQHYIQCIMRDITERKKAEQKLRDSEKKYRNLFEDSPFAIILINPRGMVVDCNPAMERLLGYTKEEFIDHRFINLSIIHQDFLVMLLKRFKKEVKGENLPAMDLKFYKKDGTLIWANVQTSFVQIDDHTYFQIMAHDITEQKEAEEDIRNILKIERIVSIISSRFVGFKDINLAINDSLRDLCRLSGSDRSYVFMISGNEHTMKTTHEWIEDGTEVAKSLRSLDVRKFPWLVKMLRNGEFLLIDNISELPPEATSTKMMMERYDIDSLLLYPIYVRDILAGFIGFDNIQYSKEWSYDNFAFLTIFAEILGSGLEREHVENSLRTSENKFHDLFDRANFYKELFIHDINDIFSNIQLSLDNFSRFNDQIVSTTNEYLRENIETHCEEGLKIISIIKKLTILEDAELPITKVELCGVIKDSIAIIQTDFSERNLNIELISQDKTVQVLANDLLEDVFENILISSIKYNEKSKIEIKILVFKKHIDNKSYVQIELVDNEPVISDLSKDKILEGRKNQQEKSKGLLLRFLLVERILDSIKGRIWVENNNFVVLIPATDFVI